MAACQLLLVVGHAVSFPFFALYLTRARGLSPSAAGLFMASSMLFSAAGYACGGDLSDVWGRVRVMRAALTLRSLAAAALAWALWQGRPVWELFALHACAGFVTNSFFPASRSWVSDHRVAADRVEAYGLLRMVCNLAWAIGPAMGGALAAEHYPALFLATALLGGACAAALPWILGRDLAVARPDAVFSMVALFSPARDRRYLFFTACVLLICSVSAQLVAPLSMYAASHGGLSAGRIGLLFSINGAVVVLAQWPAARLISRGRLSAAMALGCLFYAAGYGAVGFARGFGAFAAAVAVVTLGEVTVSPALQALSVNLAPAAMQGRFAGFCGLMEHLGLAAGPLAGGILQQRLGAGAWPCVAAAGVLAAAGFFVAGRGFSRAEEGLSQAPAESAQVAGNPAVV